MKNDYEREKVGPSEKVLRAARNLIGKTFVLFFRTKISEKRVKEMKEKHYELMRKSNFPFL